MVNNNERANSNNNGASQYAENNGDDIERNKSGVKGKIVMAMQQT